MVFTLILFYFAVVGEDLTCWFNNKPALVHNSITHEQLLLFGTRSHQCWIIFWDSFLDRGVSRRWRSRGPDRRTTGTGYSGSILLLACWDEGRQDPGRAGILLEVVVGGFFHKALSQQTPTSVQSEWVVRVFSYLGWYLKQIVTYSFWISKGFLADTQRWANIKSTFCANMSYLLRYQI